MIKLLAISVVAVALAACSSMGMDGPGTQPNAGATKNSSDANKSGNSAAVSPGGAAGTGGTGK